MSQRNDDPPVRVRDYVCPPCRLATEHPEYADEHERCHGASAIRRPGAPDHEVPLQVLRCGCGERGHQATQPRLRAEAFG